MDTIIFIHGLGRTSLSMMHLQKIFERDGYKTLNIHYASHKQSIEESATYLKKIIKKNVDNSSTLHFVTHSLGGLVVRTCLKDEKSAHVGRVVMMCPPNQGSELATCLQNYWLYKKILGPAGQQLGIDFDDYPHQLGPVHFQLGVIAGSKSWSFLSHIFPDENDGRLTINRAKIEGMTDFLVVPCGHTLIMYNRLVIKQIRHFLKTGSFNHFQ